MIASKHIDKIVIVIVVIAAIAVLCMVAFIDTGDAGVVMTYEEELFGADGVMRVNIIMDDAEWRDMMETAADEVYYACDLEINAERIYNVGIRAKGNSSLMSVAASGSDRYSFKIKLDEYVKGQTFKGLDKLVLNNNYGDATMMKEAVTYDMFAWLGADASLSSYAEVAVNGKYTGLYLALEAVEESFALRNYGLNYGRLYKPDTMNLNQMGDELGIDIGGLLNGFGEEGGFSFASIFGSITEEQFEGMKAAFMGSGEDGGFGGFGGFGGGDSSLVTALNYIDNDLSTYDIIWESSVFGSGNSDHRRVLEAIKHINAGEDFDQYMDVDAMLRYLAVHTFVVNMDSVSSNMPHNYYLYEEDGQLRLIPWDYNLAFGGQELPGSSVLINFPIDTPFSGVSLDDRQFFMAILEDEACREQYHEYLIELVEGYVYGGEFDAFFERTREQIDELVRSDPTGFFDYDDYEAATDMFYQVMRLRADSIAGQVAGTIPSTTSGQAANPELLLDDSSVNVAVMGSMMENMMGAQLGDGMGDLDFSNLNIEDLTYEDFRRMLGLDETQAPEAGDASDDTNPFGALMGFDTGMIPAGLNMNMLSGLPTIINAALIGLCFVAIVVAAILVNRYKRK